MKHEYSGSFKNGASRTFRLFKYYIASFVNEFFHSGFMILLTLNILRSALLLGVLYADNDAFKPFLKNSFAYSLRISSYDVPDRASMSFKPDKFIPQLKQ